MRRQLEDGCALQLAIVSSVSQRARTAKIGHDNGVLAP